MKALRHAFFILIIGLISAGQALSAQENPNSEWVHITKSSDDTKFYSGKKGSYELTSTKGGTPIALILGQTEDKKAKSVSYGKWYVTAGDCEAGVGKLVILKVSGDYEMEADYVSKGNSIASGIGDFICSVYFYNKKEQQDKGV
jgi:hypothetical protein